MSLINENFTPEQAIACEKYLQVKEHAIEQWYASLTIEDKEQIIKQFNLADMNELHQKHKEIGDKHMITWNPPGHSKSSLYQRLLNGKKPLVFRPPILFSYPWYDVVESQTPISCNSSDIYTHLGTKYSEWELVEKISNNEFFITHKEWKTKGFMWKLAFVSTPLKNSSFVFFGTMMHGKPIHTEEELRNDILTIFDFERKIALAQHSQNNEDIENVKQSFVNHYGASGEANYAYFVNKVSLLMESRLAKGLTPYFDEKELEKEIKESINNRLGDLFIKDGLIYTHEWTIQRTFPLQLDSSHYLDI